SLGGYRYPCVDRTYTVEGFGEAGCPHPEGTRRLPKVFLFLVLNRTDFALEARRGHPEGTRAPPSLPRWGCRGRLAAPCTPTQQKHCGKPLAHYGDTQRVPGRRSELEIRFLEGLQPSGTLWVTSPQWTTAYVHALI